MEAPCSGPCLAINRPMPVTRGGSNLGSLRLNILMDAHLRHALCQLPPSLLMQSRSPLLATMTKASLSSRFLEVSCGSAGSPSFLPGHHLQGTCPRQAAVSGLLAGNMQGPSQTLSEVVTCGNDGTRGHFWSYEKHSFQLVFIEQT